MSRPFFSIITATFNAEKTLSRLLDSLAAQTCRDFNWIVQDGDSQDRTVEIAESYRERLPEILLESAPDSGIYDAWNKALDRADDKLGQWVIFLGGDDELYAPDSLAQVRSLLTHAPDDLIFACGDALLVGGKESVLFPANVQTGLRFLPYNMPCCHTAMFTRGDILKKYRFDSSYAIAGDHELIARVWHSQSQALYIKILVAKMSIFGVSSTNARQIAQEKMEIRKKYFFARYVISYPKYKIMEMDHAFHAQKIKLKAKLNKNFFGRSIWKFLSSLRKKFLYKQLNRR